MEKEIELSLELSLNGRFGVNTKSASNNNLIRSSSISNLPETPKLPFEKLPLTRTCSLPVESEEETRKRKEIQMLRRMEAKRKRLEKQRREIGGNGIGKFEFSGNGAPKVGLSGHGFESKSGFGLGFGNGGDNNGISYPPFSRGSSASSSGTSELESQSQTTPTTNQGMNKNTESKSPQSVQSFSYQNEQRPTESPGNPTILKKTTSIDTAKMVNTNLNRSKFISETTNTITNVLTDMPCVSTKEGPNCKRVEGFLYRYRKGEEVRIVCVCHGSFLTPAEFIKHAGGGDVEHPLRHIVVKPSPFV